jgi:hypothetical protein
MLDASWNSGGDVLMLPKAGTDYTIAKSGSVVTLSGESQTITVPVGIAGMTLRFTDGDRVLFYDTKDQSFKLSEQVITGTANKVSEMSQVISLDSSIYQYSVKTIDAEPMHYLFVDDPAKASSVVIEHAYVGDVLQLSATHKDKPKTDEHKRNLSLSQKGIAKNYIQTAEHRRKNSEANSGKNNPMYGPCSEERAANISAAKKAQQLTAYNKNIPMTEAQKQKIKETKEKNKVILTCEVCSKTMRQANFKQYGHGPTCRQKP